MAGSIFKEVSFTPHTFSKEYTLIDPRRRLGKLIQILENLQDSGIIIGIDRCEWIKEINQFIDAYEDDDKIDLHKQFVNLDTRNRISTYPQIFDRNLNENEWIEQAVVLNQIRSLDFLVSTVEHKIAKKIETIDSSEYRYAGAKIIVQTEENMKEIIAPILAYAEISTIIDPYFDLSKPRYADALKIICECLGNHHGIQEKSIIDIHTSVKPLTDKNDIFDWKFANPWVQLLQKFEQQFGHTISIHVWEDHKKTDEWHDRWIITNQCGITIGKGSDISNWTDSTWGIIEWSEIPNITNKFVPNRNIYSHIGVITIKGLTKDKRAKNQVLSIEERMSPKEQITTPRGMKIQKKNK